MKQFFAVLFTLKDKNGKKVQTLALLVFNYWQICTWRVSCLFSNHKIATILSNLSTLTDISWGGRVVPSPPLLPLVYSCRMWTEIPNRSTTLLKKYKRLILTSLSLLDFFILSLIFLPDTALLWASSFCLRSFMNCKIRIATRLTIWISITHIRVIYGRAICTTCDVINLTVIRFSW